MGSAGVRRARVSTGLLGAARLLRPGCRRDLRARLYDVVIVPLTSPYYRLVLDRLPDGARLLDVGIGTGAALAANADLIVGKELRVHGIDTDEQYLARCARHVARAGLDGRVTVELVSVHDHAGGPYDAAYFSDSLMVLADPARAVARVAAALTEHGRVYFTQTFHDRPVPVLERLKPRVRWLTAIDFGRVTYDEDFRETVDRAGLEIEVVDVLRRTRRTSNRLVVARRPSAVLRS